MIEVIKGAYLLWNENGTEYRIRALFASPRKRKRFGIHPKDVVRGSALRLPLWEGHRRFLICLGRSGVRVLKHGLHGLGILVPLRLKEQNEEFAKMLEALKHPPVVERYVERTEKARLEMEIHRQECRAQLEEEVESLRRGLAELEAGRREEVAGLRSESCGTNAMSKCLTFLSKERFIG